MESQVQAKPAGPAAQATKKPAQVVLEAQEAKAVQEATVVAVPVEAFSEYTFQAIANPRAKT